MILAGIDEAGYGPLLGPLVVGCCAFELNADPAGELPCIWKRLGKLVSKTRCKAGRRIQINDSKTVYQPGPNGLRELERGILTLSAAKMAPGGTSGQCGSLNGLLERVSPEVVPSLGEYEWYDAALDGSFPADVSAESVGVFANALRLEMEKTMTRCVHLNARVVLERDYNRQVEATRNKSSLLFSTAAIHLDFLLRNYGTQGLVIFCDQQGGRAHYGPLLRMMFEDWSLEIITEGNGRSEYHLLKGAHVVRIIFCEKAEAQCLPVAAASMLCKYLREMLMRRFNAFWKQHLSTLAPTAGYYTDGIRFLKDIAPLRQQMNIRNEDLIRSR